MSLEVQKKLLKDVKEGKNLILFGRLPEYDENLNTCTYLMDELGIYDYEYRDYDCWGQKLILKNQYEEILQDQYPMVEIHTKKEHQIIATDQKNRTVAIKIAYGKGNCYLYTSAIDVYKRQRSSFFVHD